MKISSEKLQASIWAAPFFLVSLFVFPYAQLGDQEFYRGFYNGIAGLSFSDAFQVYKNTLGTSEPGYFIFIFMFSSIFNKDFLLSVINFFFLYYLFLWMIKNKVSRLVFPALYLNFYILVLAFSAERLKLSLLVFLIGFNLAGLARYFLYASSVLVHVQFVLLLCSTQVKNILLILTLLRRGRVGYGALSLFFMMGAVLLVLIILREHIASKISSYYGVWGGAESVIKPIVFTCLSIFYARSKRMEALLSSLPLVLAAYFFGAERIAIFSYFIFMFYGLQKNRGLNVGVIVTSIYFFYKGVNFLINILLHGDGFSGLY